MNAAPRRSVSVRRGVRARGPRAASAAGSAARPRCIQRRKSAITNGATISAAGDVGSKR
jgi:hypothetical protein